MKDEMRANCYLFSSNNDVYQEDDMLILGKITSKLGAITAIGLLGLCMACETSGSVDLRGSNTGHITYDAKIKVKFQFLIIGDVNPVEPEYVINVDGYPYNRILLNGNMVSRNSLGKVISSTPMVLTEGSVFYATITIGGFTNTYTTTVRTNSTLPSTTYILDAPGLVQDVQAALQDYPGSSMVLTTSGLEVQKVLPVGSELAPVVQNQIGSNSIAFDFPSEVMLPWVALRTTPDRPIHPPIQTPE